jgi:putative membrane protein
MKSLLIAFAVIVPTAIVAADMNSNPDAHFFKNAAEGGMAEVELGNLAQKKSEDASVKDFGAMMVKDHTAANDKLKALANSKNIKLPTSPSMGQMATKTKLEVLSGKSFDKSYIKGMIKDHETDIKEFKKESASGKDPEAKAFATATLPTLEEHLRKIESIAKSQGVKEDHD